MSITMTEIEVVIEPTPTLTLNVRRLLSLDLGKFRSMHLGIFNQWNTD